MNVWIISKQKYILTQIVLLKSTEIVKTQYLKHILPYKKKSEKELFREHDIDDNDWSGKNCFFF